LCNLYRVFEMYDNLNDEIRNAENMLVHNDIFFFETRKLNLNISVWSDEILCRKCSKSLKLVFEDIAW
jgi:hypothetical protein